MPEETKKCPFCGEEILAEAKKCRHCKKWLEDNISSLNMAEVIESYINQTPRKTQFITTKANITSELLNESKMRPKDGEIPLLLCYKKHLMYDLKTRILITDKRIYFKALPDTFWVGLTCNFAKKIEGNCEIYGLNYLEIAEHDHCFGTAYVGHQLKINDEVVGLIRMGTGVEYDEEAIKYLNGLFNELADKGIIRNRVREYAWQ